jgi:small subunit ribosomal protein S3Ae
MAEKEASPKKTTLARTVKDKWRSKHWYVVRAPSLFNHAEIGETMASEPQEISGGADIGKAHIKLRFQIDRISGEKTAESRFIGHELTTDYVRRLARRKRSKIDTSLMVTTKDGVQIIVKPIAVGEQRLQTRLQAELRMRLRSLLLEGAKQKTGAEFVREMLGGDLGKALAHGLKSLYPLKKIEIRRSDVLGIIEVGAPGEPAAEAVDGPAPEGPLAPESAASEAADA